MTDKKILDKLKQDNIILSAEELEALSAGSGISGLRYCKAVINGVVCGMPVVVGKESLHVINYGHDPV